MNLRARARTIAFSTVILAAANMLAPAQTGTVALQPMAKNADPAFEVATIRPGKAPFTSQGFHKNGHRISLENETVTNMICVAYRIHHSQIVGAPAWFDTDPYDIDGVPDVEGEPNLHQMQIMIQKLLADRFGLKFHHEKRELPVYAITIAKGGPRLTPNTTGREDDHDATGYGRGSMQVMKYTDASMDDFALEMQFDSSRPIINQTNLTGRYDFTLRWTNDNAPPSNDPNAPPGFFTAIQEQLGLKLEPTKGPTDVLVIDHVERPSAN